MNFPSLEEVFVDDCGSLTTLFPSSVAKNLGKLRTLELKCCAELVEIVEKDDDAMEHGTTEMFEFPFLSLLHLYKLPLLSCFYPGKNHLVCPVLERLHVARCPHLELFTSEFHDSNIQVRSTSQPLFSIEKFVPTLKVLTLNEKSIISLSDEHFPQNLLCKLNDLWLYFEDHKSEKHSLPFDLFHKVPSLEHLRVRNCFGLKEIFPSQKLLVHDGVLARLKELFLLCLEELESIGLEQPWVKPYSEKLQILHLSKCPRLEQLVCCTVSFINLKEIVVTLCGRMEYLFKSSTATSLVQLEILVIQDCESTKEIVTEDASHKIVFGRLKTLRLHSLPRLVRFYSGNATLQFLCLEKATVAKCPNIKTFSEGVVNAPMLLGIQTSSREDSDLTFHNYLNTTIHRLFQKQISGLIDYVSASFLLRMDM
ncbi:hypothetical protein VNO78_15379 [Psophocarpus tetragonolobus]|uniref:Disease resistance protein At4g27190-like leucine-rich repeats domain-containing protein n=1 Tax=Psophocarpus tetragonolobus TaxID=3891 RepID=A0AAN9SIN7_PSOTE